MDSSHNRMYTGCKYHFDNIPNLFMSSDNWKHWIVELIDVFISCQRNQDDVDHMYSNFCKMLTSEMDIYLKYTDASQKTRKRYRNSKPYWDDNLTEL